jgi:phage terminase large subunit-like protein
MASRKKTGRRASSDGSGGYYFDKPEADRAVQFFEQLLCHGKGEWAGQPFRLEPWQADEIIRPLFGWKRPDGTRRYRTVYVEMGRKQGKSAMAAGVALYLLFADGEPGAEVYSAAADRKQASLVFDEAKRMVLESPELARRSDVFARSIVIPKRWSRYEVLSADAPTKHGLNASGVIFDELHAQPNRDLWDVLKTSTGARRQPVIFAITTAGFDRTSIGYEIHSYACRVRDGVVTDDTFLPVIYSADDSEDWTAVETWKRANPNLGVTIKQSYLEQECASAREMPAYQNTFRRLHLCQWTEQDTRWMPMDRWEACAEPFDPEQLKGKVCFAGLDLSSTTDISALVLVFAPNPDEGETDYFALPYFWMPEANIQKRARRDGVPFDAWVRDGFIEATPGNVIDYDRIRQKLDELNTLYPIREIAIDRWNSTQLQTQLTDDGFTVEPFGQGYKDMSAPTKELGALVLSQRLRHGGNPVLRWMAGNVAVLQDAAGNLKPAKDKSADRIDGVVAMIMALGRIIVGTEPWCSLPGVWITTWGE